MRIKKFIAVITAACFLWSFTGQSLASAGAGTGFAGEAVFENDSLISNSLGYVSQSGSFGSPQVIISIQDLHSHPAVQKNIASIIETLDKRFNISAIYLEGASGKVDTFWLAKIENEKSKKNLADQMILDGALTGVEYYSLFNKNKSIIGLEDSKIHKQNIERLGKIYENEGNYKEIAGKIKNEIDYLAGRYLNSESRKYTKLTQKYRSGELTQAKYYSRLFEMADKINANPSGYGNVLRIDKEEYGELRKVINISELSEKIKPAKVRAEISSYVSELKDSLSYSQYSAFLANTDELRDIDSLCKYISFYGINGHDKQQLKAFVVLNRMNSEINPVAMFLQEQNLQEKINAAFSTTAMQSEISFLQSFYPFFEGYLTNSLTAQDEQYFVEKYELFSNMYAKYAAFDHVLLLQDNFGFLNEYYSTNNLRNEIFISNIDKYTKLVPGRSKNNDPAVKIVNEARDIIVIVAGGYHTKGMSEILDSKRISNITITPRVSGDVRGALSNYKQIIMEQSRFFREALAFAVASQMPAAEQYGAVTEAIMKLCADESRTQDEINDLLQTLNAVEKETFGEDKDALINNRYRAVANGAFKFAGDIDYSNDNIKNLAGIIRLIAGKDSLNVKFIGDSNSEIEFSNGSVISFGKGENGKIVKGDTFAQSQADGPVTLKTSAFAKLMAAKGFNLASLTDINDAQTYTMVKDILLLSVMSESGLLQFDDSGAIPAIALKYEGKSVDGIPYELISRMPEFFQKAAFARQQAADAAAVVPHAEASAPVKKAKPFMSRIKSMLLSVFMIVMLFTTSACGVHWPAQAEVPSSPGIEQQVPGGAAIDGGDVLYVKGGEVARNYDVSQSMFIKDGNGYNLLYIIDENNEMIAPNIKGVAYAPSAENAGAYAANYREDLKKIFDTGANFIRTYYLFAVYDADGNIDYDATREMLDYAHSLGLKIMVGANYEQMDESVLGKYLSEVGGHPAIALFALGNEYEVPAKEKRWGFDTEDLYKRLAEAAKTIENSGVKKAYVTVTADVPSDGELARYADAGILVSPNIYRGNAINLGESDYRNLAGIIGEYGASALDADGKDISNEQANAADSLIGDLVRLMNENKINGGFFFQFRQDAAKPGYVEQGYGLFDFQGKPLPAAEIFTGKMSAVSDAHYVTAVNVTDESDETSFEAAIQPQAAENLINASMPQNPDSGDGWASLYISLEEKIATGDILTVTVSGTPNTNIHAEFKNPFGNPNVPGVLAYEGVTDADGKLTFDVAVKDAKNTNFVISYGQGVYGSGLNASNDGKVSVISMLKSELELETTKNLLDRFNITGKPRAVAAAVLELPQTLFSSPEAFARKHINKTEEQRVERERGARYIRSETLSGGIYGLLSGAVLACLSMIFLGALPAAAAFSIAGATAVVTIIAFAVSKNILAHFRWNYKTFNADMNIIYTDEAGLEKAKSVFGSKITKADGGRISAPIYIINEVGDLSDYMDNYKNMGIKIDGRIIWVRKDTENGIVFYANGIDREKISAALQQGGLGNIVRSVMDSQKMAMPGQMTVNAVEVNALEQAKRGFEYNEQGNPYIYVDVNAENAELSEILFDHVRTVAKAEAWTYAQQYMIFLDNINTPAEFDGYIKNILGRASNGNIIINAELAKALYGQNKFAALLSLVREDGISIMVEDSAPAEIKQAADGVYDKSAGTVTNPMNLLFEAQEVTAIDETVANFGQAAESARGIVVIYESAMEKYLENDRSGFAKFILDIWTSPKTLKKLFAEPVTAEAAGATARNLDTAKIIRQFEGLTVDKVKELHDRYFASGDISSALEAEFGLNNSAGKYLEKIAAQELPAREIKEITDAFAQGLIEKLLAAASLKENGNIKGLKNKKAEKVLGRLLAIQYIMPSVSVEREDAIIGDLHSSNESTYMEKITAMLHNKEHVSAKVAAAAAEMLIVFSKEIEFDESMAPTVTNTQAISSILSAA